MAPREDVVDLGIHFAILRKSWWKVALFSLAVGVATLIVMFQLPNVYQATAVITPSIDEKKQNPALGVLASSFGVSIGGPSSIEDLESLFRSNDLTARVFQKYDLWSIALGDRFDATSRTIKTSLLDYLSGTKKGARPPADWDAIRAARKRLKIYTNKKAGTLVLSFESYSADGSANVVKYYLEEGKDRLQEEAFQRASRNKKFIEEQTRKTPDALTRDRLYFLYGQEVEKEMMARNRDQFGFKIVDSPRTPDRKSGPHRFLIALLTAVLSFIVSSVLLTIWWKRHPAKYL
jgi:uncharacterized protein involved in exopolysaccharide biosynthesis